MKATLGIDTSNYKTSAALFYDDGTYAFYGMFIPVESGERGVRQSEAVFLHLKQLPQILDKVILRKTFSYKAIGVSSRPRDIAGSYMPCFVTGQSFAESISYILNIPFYQFSHQSGHVMAAIIGSKQDDLKEKEFLSWHVSGGTTELLHVIPSEETIFKVRKIAGTLDLNCGQIIDRVGVMLGLDFPCGLQLEQLSLLSDKRFKIKPAIKDGNCCLSGIENQCRKMLLSGHEKEDIAKFCLDSICEVLDVMSSTAMQQYSGKPLLCAGGVMANSMINQRLTEKYGAVVGSKELSGDNAVGIAALAKEKADRDGR